MKSFFKYVLATITGIIISSVLLFVILIAIVGYLVSSVSPTTEAVTPSNAVLLVTLDHSITEKTEPNPFEGLEMPGYSNIRSIGLNDIVSRIQAAKEDTNIKGIYLNVKGINTGFATMKAIRDAIEDFKASGKFVVAYSDNYTQKGYYLSSVANEVYLHPEGGLDFRGLASSVMFFKDALTKLGVEMQVLKVGTYKSAVEPYLLNAMSDANREQVGSYLGSIYSTFVGDIAKSRELTADTVRGVANAYAIKYPEDAVRLHFVDSLMYKDQILAKIREKLAIDDKKDIPTISLLDYKNSPATGKGGADRVAVLYAYGAIVDGEGTTGEIGGDKLSRELRDLRNDDKVKAIVLRVNSPGGSALASDVIWREVDLTKKVKPVVVSMGDYAASGGYYIAAAADSIFADPTTLTGSIGVFGVIPSFQKLFNEKLGVHFDAVKTAKYADMDVDMDRPLTEEEKGIIQGSVNRVYQVFMKRVADGRKMSIANVDSIGQGRVWTGAQAVDLKLVDRLASLDEAVKAAAKKAKVSDYRVYEYPRTKDPFAEIWSVSKEKVQAMFIDEELGEYAKYLKELRKVTSQTGIQARIPYLVEIY
ncbi:signal peptide peptidase SppA [Sphingobacterium sp. DK4209]|uniref:Signal peptide peptidase SppA n=1 Tax=Sphingobacterium zhuxiongii TaxID=2662364 RepID=A0A5Q0Q9V9_9SPHI|nr:MULTISPECIES: signal peptide peptidase SppA [unclassified Sphingobacterium]MVZ64302.1 signal peptide peptidase SppA [Sphingobacterium sp. DK4209]QGA25651.1 signal peptide peptidase SppA [Sphingobacterium sp. dk4302]